MNSQQEYDEIFSVLLRSSIQLRTETLKPLDISASMFYRTLIMRGFQLIY